MLAKDFYTNNYNINYDLKYEKGKNVYDDFLQSYVIKYCFNKYLRKNISILDIGTYSGRITKKLESYSADITISDVDIKNIYGLDKYDNYTIDLSIESTIDKKFDLVCSLGHQASFCNNIDMAISNISNFLDGSRGVMIVDFWSSNETSCAKPQYSLERISENEIKEIFKNKNLEILDIFYSGRLHAVFGRYWAFFINRFLKKGSVISKLYICLESLFKKRNVFSEKTQTIIVIAKRIS